MLDWNEYQKQLMRTFAKIGKVSHGILKGYNGLSSVIVF